MRIFKLKKLEFFLSNLWLFGFFRPESTLPLGQNQELVDEFPEISGITTAREAMKKMPEKDKAKIAEQVEVFRVEKRKFDIEVSKWDDNGNDIIVLGMFINHADIISGFSFKFWTLFLLFLSKFST